MTKNCPIGKVVITDLPDADAHCTWCGQSFSGLTADQYREIRETNTLPHTERKS